MINKFGIHVYMIDICYIILLYISKIAFAFFEAYHLYLMPIYRVSIHFVTKLIGGVKIGE